MNINEKKEKLINLREELQGIISAGEQEVRELSEDENNRMAEIRSEIDTLEAEIETEEKENRQLNKQKTNNKMERTNEIRLFDLVKAVANGQVSDEQRQFIDGNKIMYERALINAGTATEGQENVSEEKRPLEMAIRNASVLNRIGASWLGNCVGDVSIPKYSGSEVSWKGENATADNGEGEFSEVVLQPKRLTGVVRISKTFLDQDANSAEALLIKDLADAVAEKLDMTVFGTSGATTTQPAGLFADTGYTTTGSSLSDINYDSVLDLELKVEEKNGTNYIFVAAPNIKFGLKGSQMASGLQMVWSNNEIDGYKAVVSNSVTKGGIIALDPRDLQVCVWRNTEIVVDPYTLAADNAIRLIVNLNVDVKLKGDRIAAAIFE